MANPLKPAILRKVVPQDTRSLLLSMVNPTTIGKVQDMIEEMVGKEVPYELSKEGGPGKQTKEQKVP